MRLGRGGWALVACALWFLALGSSAAVIHARHRARELFVELEKLNTRRDNLEIEWGQLQLEQSAWSSPAFVEQVALTQRHMSMPAPRSIKVVQP
jgi:cell division protein FtsL